MHFADFLIFTFACGLGAVAMATLLRAKRNGSESPVPLALFTAVAVALTMIAIATRWLEQTGDPWNNARLTPAVALHYGFKLYYPLHDGPVLSTVVGPVAFLAYWPVGFLTGSPTTLILVASALNLLAGAVLLGALVRQVAQDWALRWLAALIAVQFFIYFPSLRYSLFCIHADAPALLLGALGAGLVIYSPNELSWRRAALAALSLALAVWAKQSLAPIFLAVLVVAALRAGTQAAVRFAAASAAIGCMVSGAFVWWLGYSNLRDNMFAVPAAHPWHQMSLATGEIFPGLNANGRLAHLKVLAAGGLQILRATWPLFATLLVALVDARRDGQTGRRWARPAWTGWLLVAVVLVPTAAIGRTKVGGEVNHESFVVLYLVTAAVCWMASFGVTEGRAVPGRLVAVLAVLLAINVPRALEYPGWRAAWANQNEAAFRYDRQHPGEIYFPWNPLTSLLAEGKLYHFDYGVFDRNLGGAVVSGEHIARYLPPGRPKIASYLAHHDYILRTYYSNYTAGRPEPDLAGWKIFEPR